jgi:Fe-S cluster assembly protein SufD
MSLPSTSDQTSIFQMLLEKHYSQLVNNSAMQKYQTKAWDHFLSLGLPTKNNDVFRYVPLKQLFSQSFGLSKPTAVTAAQVAPYTYPECKNSLLVFVNGHYQPVLSNISALPKNVVISPLQDALRTYNALLNNQWSKFLKEETDPFTTLNAALHQDGGFIYLPPKSIVEAPIQILHIIDINDAPLFIMPRLHIFVGSQSEVTFATCTTVLSGSNYCFNQAIEFAVEDDAHVKHLQMAMDTSSEGWHLDSIRATLKRNCTFKTICLTDGGSTVRHDYRVTMTGENSEASLNGLWMLNEKRESHIHVLIDHQAPNCRSFQLYKGVVNDFSRSSFEGKILVRQAAQKTDAFQLNNNLLLSDRAHADSKPNLEIFADDVKASHGATVGQLDEEQLFYMQTRGFSKAEAQNMLVYSFSKELLDMIPIESVVNSMNARAKKYLNRG